MTSLPLFQPHSATSRAAWIGSRPKAGTLRGALLAHLDFLAERGATDEEMQQALGIDPNTQRPRRVELHEGGFIADSGRRRPTRSGRGAVVWVAVGKKEKPEHCTGDAAGVQ